MFLTKDQTLEFVADGRRYLLVYLGESPFDCPELCTGCDISVMSQVLPHVHVLGELPASHPDDPGENGASYRDYLRWLVADHVIAGGTRLAMVSRAAADDIIRQFRSMELQRRDAEMRERAAG